MTDTRKDFEAWMLSKNKKYKPTDDGMSDRALWECAQYFWQAGAQHERERIAKKVEGNYGWVDGVYFDDLGDAVRGAS